MASSAAVASLSCGPCGQRCVARAGGSPSQTLFLSARRARRRFSGGRPGAVQILFRYDPGAFQVRFRPKAGPA
eukprot:6574627-Lingulodinium_polyedra.AAC.1